MVTRRFRRRSFRRGPRRRTAWTMQTVAPATLTPGTQTAIELTPYASTPTAAGGAATPLGMLREGLTLTRTIIDGAIYVPDIDGNPHNAELWFGLLVISEQAWATAGAIPAPGVDDADWALVGCRYVAHRSSIAAGFDPLSAARLDFDLRSRRRLRSGDDRLIWILRNDASSLDNVDSNWCVRCLFMLP